MRALLEQLEAAYARTDQLFSLLPEGGLYDRPIPLRHPFIFYLGHLPAFAWNQAARGALGLAPMNATFDQLFERGIDPEDEDATAPELAWPEVGEILAYRDRIRASLPDLIPALTEATEDPLPSRVLALVLEHELMHQETLLYMVQECPDGRVRRPDALPAPRGGPGRAAEPREVSGGAVTIGARWDDLDFGWDNEFQQETHEIPGFLLDSLPVRNQDWLDLLDGRDLPELWPRPWVRTGEGIAVKTVFGHVPFDLAAGWPVQVSGVQARVYAEVHGGRLPTELELRRAALGQPAGAPGNHSFASWAPAPVGEGPADLNVWGVEELVGNGWEWTCTPFRPLSGFRAWARSYPGYSADFFDDAHDVVFGASWATAPRLLRPSFRNWYRRSYPFAFTKFRVCRDRA